MMVLGLAALLTSGCDKKEAEAKAAVDDGPPSKMVTDLGAIADEGCACKDWTCGVAARSKVEAFAKTISKVEDRDMKPMQAHGTRLDTCLSELNPRMHEYRTLNTDICACKDKKCGEKVAKQMTKWSKDVQQEIKEGHRLSQVDLDIMTKVGTIGTACYNKLGVPVPR